ncbi:hypothetical protein [Corynebacterium pseudotuberculosis]|uniref:hypothetical protein n=1 Tax=Corynebacterium pseudotuberculosis TaxID=1719 RepID=UPI001E5E6858|nr:hypothetical protein [Corynebacterium pseudotuberculosis]
MIGQSGFLVEDADEQLGDVVREVLQIHVLAVGGDVLGDEFLGGLDPTREGAQRRRRCRGENRSHWRASW